MIENNVEAWLKIAGCRQNGLTDVVMLIFAQILKASFTVNRSLRGGITGGFGRMEFKVWMAFGEVPRRALGTAFLPSLK